MSSLLDMITIARTTKLTKTAKENLEDECAELRNNQAVAAETEFYAGEQGQQSEDENITGSGSWKATYVFDRDAWVSILSVQERQDRCTGDADGDL